MNITLHQTHHQIADFEGIFTYIKEQFSKTSSGIHVFPELFLTGYPLQDLCLQKPFVDRYQVFLSELTDWCSTNINEKTTCLLIGGLKYDLSQKGIPISIRNVVFQYGDGLKMEDIYTKRLLPNYDIFDEKKYFSKGNTPKVQTIFGKQFGLLICEDMWASSFHELDPVADLFKMAKKNKYLLAGIINLSASPFNLDKAQKRLQRAMLISNQFECPFFYTNRVGGEDEILFDGRSFIVNGDTPLVQGKKFAADILKLELPGPGEYTKGAKSKESLTWEELFQANLDTSTTPAKLHPWSDDQCQEVLESLCFGVQEYAGKSGFKKFTIALSGGMDSALVLTILCLSLKKDQFLEAVYMPSVHSSPLSFELSLQLCKNLGIPLKSLPIKFLHSAGKNLFGQTFSEPFDGLTDENIQSRLRGMLLYTRSNQINSMVVNTSNKSELAVGYSTQYGDSVGAISMLGDLYKSEVYRLAEYINQKFKNIIPEVIITREPTAELREGQIDSQTLPPYERLDAILEGILNYRYAKKDLLELGFSEEEVEKTLNMYRRNEYKRYQFCPILKVSSKSFGFGYRIPISKYSGFYNQ